MPGDNAARCLGKPNEIIFHPPISSLGTTFFIEHLPAAGTYKLGLVLVHEERMATNKGTERFSYFVCEDMCSVNTAHAWPHAPLNGFIEDSLIPAAQSEHVKNLKIQFHWKTRKSFLLIRRSWFAQATRCRTRLPYIYIFCYNYYNIILRLIQMAALKLLQWITNVIKKIQNRCWKHYYALRLCAIGV